MSLHKCWVTYSAAISVHVSISPIGRAEVATNDQRGLESKYDQNNNWQNQIFCKARVCKSGNQPRSFTNPLQCKRSLRAEHNGRHRWNRDRPHRATVEGATVTLVNTGTKRPVSLRVLERNVCLSTS